MKFMQIASDVVLSHRVSKNDAPMQGWRTKIQADAAELHTASRFDSDLSAQFIGAGCALNAERTTACSSKKLHDICCNKGNAICCDVQTAPAFLTNHER